MSFIPPFADKFTKPPIVEVSGLSDADAQAWIDRLTAPIPQVQTALNTFIISEKLAGTNNFNKWDEFFCLGLGSTNSVIGAIAKTGTAFGGITFDNTGADFNGTDGYIDTDWNPSVDGDNFTQNDAMHGGLVVSWADELTQLIWGHADDTGKRNQFGPLNGTTLLTSVNSANKSTVFALLEDTLYVLARSGSANFKIFEDGVDSRTVTVASATLDDETFALGASNDTPVANFWEGKLFSFVVGGAIGFDQDAHNTNVRQLKADLV